jgi:uncharacterized protein
MSKIIISYRRSDSDVFAGRIRDRIASRYGDASVFMDIDDIPFGKDFRQHIKEALTESDVVVVIIGPRWLGAGKSGGARIQDEIDPVRIEVETALQHGIPIIPVLVGDTKMPKPTQLPEALKNFAFINAAPVDTGRDFHPHMERLLREIDRILGSKNGGLLRNQVKPAGERKPSSGSRTLKFGLALMFVAVLAGVGMGSISSFSDLFTAGSKAVTSTVHSTAGTPAAIVALSAPSFDCGQTQSSVERTICDAKDISAKHQLVNNLYAFLQSRRASDEQFKNEQLSWRNALMQCRGDGMFGCINNAHDARIATLKMGPSYPCHIDKNLVEQAICKDVLLSTKDQVMHDLYQAVIAEMTVATYRTARKEQQDWITAKRDACDGPQMISCISQAYDSRIVELDGMVRRR